MGGHGSRPMVVLAVGREAMTSIGFNICGGGSPLNILHPPKKMGAPFPEVHATGMVFN